MKNMEAKRKQFQNESSSTPTIDGTLAQWAEVTNEVATYDPHCSPLLMEINGCNFPIYLFQLLKFAREKVFRVFRCHSGGPGLLGGDVQWFSTHWMITTSSTDYINPLDLSKKDMIYFNFEHKVMAPFQPRQISIVIFSVKWWESYQEQRVSKTLSCIYMQELRRAEPWWRFNRARETFLDSSCQDWGFEVSWWSSLLKDAWPLGPECIQMPAGIYGALETS